MSEKHSLVIDSKTGFYKRTVGTEKDALEADICKVYEAKETILASSGMNAIYLVLHAIEEHIAHSSKPSDCNVFLFANELYGDMKYQMEYLQTKPHIGKDNILTFDPECKVEEMKTIVDKAGGASRIACVFFETCSNPHGKCFNWKLLDVFDRKQTLFVADNTWLSPVLQNPLQHGAHIVVESCTKYLSGGACIGGHITFNKQLDKAQEYIIADVRQAIRLMGMHVSPLHCYMISKELKSLEARLASSSKKTERLLMALGPLSEKYKLTVYHPSNKGIVFCKGYLPSIVTITAPLKNETLLSKKWKEEFEGILQAITNIAFETSYGQAYNRICSWPKRDHAKKTLEFRVSVGHSTDEPHDVYTLVSDLERVLSVL